MWRMWKKPVHCTTVAGKATNNSDTGYWYSVSNTYDLIPNIKTLVKKCTATVSTKMMAYW